MLSIADKGREYIMDEKNYSLKDLVNDITQIVEETELDSERVERTERYVSKFIQSENPIPIEALQSDKNQYARHSLYRDPQDRFEILALIWEPGQRTGLHDHDGTWGVEGIVTGRMRIHNYLQMESYPEDNKVKLSYSGTMNLNALSTGELLPPADCHILQPEGNDTVVTIHVYGKQLRHFKVFKSTEEDNIYTVHDHPVGYTTESLITI